LAHRKANRRKIVRNVARFGAVLGAPVLSITGLMGIAQADAPVRTTFDEPATFTVRDVCPFPVTVTGQQEGFMIDSVDESGTGAQFFHVTETDTFSANGNTLQGEPYTFNFHVTLVEGVPSKFLATGVGVRVPLPDGSTFFSAGQIDFLAAGDVDFIAVPTRGGSRNLDAFCAALAE